MSPRSPPGIWNLGHAVWRLRRPWRRAANCCRADIAGDRIVVLALSMALGHALGTVIPKGFAYRFLEEGVIIVGWVTFMRSRG